MSQARDAKIPALCLLGAFDFAFRPLFLVPTGRVDLAQRLDLPQAGRHRLISRTAVKCTSRGENWKGSQAKHGASSGALASGSRVLRRGKPSNA